MDPSCAIAQRRCRPCEGGVPALGEEETNALLAQVPDWQLTAVPAIERHFSFRNHYETMTFVNAVAWVSHREDHHPELTVGYNTCTVRYWTHAINGLSENDFICAAKVDKLYEI